MHRFLNPSPIRSLFYMTARSQLAAALFSAAVVLTASACQREVSRAFRVEVATNQGDAVHDAEVRIGGRVIGQTDAKGVLESKVTVPQGQDLSVEVHKSSDQYYFAPHIETINPGKTDGKQVVVKAVLYFVPKPKLAEAPPVDGAGAAPGTPDKAAEVSGGIKDPKDSKDAKDVAVTADHPPSPQQPEASAQEPVGVVAAAPSVTEAVKAPVTAPQPEPAKPALANPDTAREVLVTFHVFAGKQSQPETKIMAMPADGDEPEKLICTTNVRGRCAVRLKAGSAWAMRAVRQGFVPATQELQLDQANKLVRFQIQKGNTLEVRVVARGMMSSAPLEGVVVSVDGKPVGTTDKGGKLLHTFGAGGTTGWIKPGASGSPMMKVELAPPKGFQPESSEYTMSPSGDLLLSRQFVASAARAPVVVIEAARRVSASHDPAAAQAFAGWVEDSFKRKVFARGILAVSNPLQKNPDIRVRRGVGKTGAGLELELVATDAKGIVISAAKEVIPEGTAKPDAKVDAMVERLIRSLPFQGMVTTADKNQIRVAMPGRLADIVAAGDRFDVFGTQPDNRGRKFTVGNIASAKVIGSDDAGAKAGTGQGELTLAVEYPAGDSRYPVARGDIVVMRGASLQPALVEAPATRENSAIQEIPAEAKPRQEKTAGRVSGMILVRENGEGGGEGGKPVAQANVYFNDVWIGTTNGDGLVKIPRDIVGASGSFHVAKPGLKPATLQSRVAANSKLEIPVEVEVARLRLDSLPSGANVYIDGKLIGKTPVDTDVAGAGAFLKLEIGGVDGYKKHASVIEAEAGTLDLTSERSIQLEPDLIAKARKASDEGNANAALEVISRIPSTHSDYLVGRHLAGEIALARLNDPAKALSYFEDVTAVPQVRDFIDKRFVGSHINEGIALHMVAEKEARSNPAKAAEDFAKAANILDRASRFVRFLPKKDFNRSVQNLEYFRALSFHRKWLISNDLVSMEKAGRGWRDYLRSVQDSGVEPGNGNSGEKTAGAKNDESAVYAANAKVYLKQVEAGMARR
ncbi:MAG: hypothetical protein RIQ81_1930 [Pseudomonadota bacterium]|jgi:hypothetical protein